jgi:hypothetical protein
MNVETAGTILAREMRLTTLSEEERREVPLLVTVASRPQWELVGGFVSRRDDLRMRKIRRVEDRKNSAHLKKVLAQFRAKTSQANKETA